MSQSLTLPGQVCRKLAQGAAERGMTVETLLTALSELVVLPVKPTAEDRQRSERIEALLDRFRAAKLMGQDPRTLDQLIDADYQAANTRADRLVRAKEHRPPHK
jgi:hypothetical protein